MKNKRPLRAYKSGEENIWTLTKDKAEGDYQKIRCPYSAEFCSSRCAFFSTSWKKGKPIFCGKIQIGVLA